MFTFAPNASGYSVPHAAFLDAGPTIGVTIGNRTGQLVRSNSGPYEDRKAFGAMAPASIIGNATLPAPLLDSGTVVADNGSGTSAIGQFRASLTIPASTTPLSFTNLTDIQAAGIGRSKDLNVIWSGGDPTSEYIVIAGGVILPDVAAKTKQGGAGFVCTEKASAGTFAVPAMVLSALPPSTPGDPMSGFFILGRAPFTADSLKFTASGLDLGYLTLSTLNGTLLAYR